jgi:hypothetical protein
MLFIVRYDRALRLYFLKWGLPFCEGGFPDLELKQIDFNDRKNPLPKSNLYKISAKKFTFLREITEILNLVLGKFADLSVSQVGKSMFFYGCA